MPVLFPASLFNNRSIKAKHTPPHFQYPCNGESVGRYGKKTIFADGGAIGASAAGNADYLLK